MKNMILAVIFTAAPTAAQPTVRVPISGVSAIPGLGATPVPTIMMMPALSLVLQAPALSALALTPTLVPSPVQPALAAGIHAAAAKPVENSPLGVIRDASANETQKAAALDRLFENSAPAGNIGPFPATAYTNLKSAIKARGVNAALAMQASRTRREGRYWFTVNILGAGDDFKKIEDLFEKDSQGWSYAGIPTDIQLRGTPVDPAAQARNPIGGKDKIALRTVDPMDTMGISAHIDKLFDTTLTPNIPVRAVSAAATVPAWFETRGLRFERVNKRETGFAYAVLSRGRYELGVFVDADGSSQATFTKFSRNPMGTPEGREEMKLLTPASRQAVAAILRRAQEASPVTGKEKAALDGMLAALEATL